MMQTVRSRTGRSWAALALCVCGTTSVTATQDWHRARATTATDLAEMLPFTVALHPANTAELDRILTAVSDPESVEYGRYLSSSEVVRLTATDLTTVARVEAALSPAVCTNRGDSLRCAAPASELARVFSTPFAAFETSTGERALVADGPLTMPASIADDVVFVAGLTELPWSPTRPSVVTSGDPAQQVAVVPDSIRLTYNVTPAGIAGAKTTSQGVAEFGGANNEKQSDLSLFGAATGLGNLSIDRRFGPPNDPQADLTEATLDIQYIASIGHGNTNWVWNSKDWMFEFATSLVSAAERPSVISVSYAWSESEQCHGLPGASNCSGTDNAGYVNRTNVEFQKVGVLGTTVLVASGDSGAHGRTDKMCLFNPKMHPTYPAASPFVTAVGGTQYSGPVSTDGVTSPICSGGKLRLPCAGSGHEVTASTDPKAGKQKSQITSGGGFSELTPQPAWQHDAVAAYLAQSDALPPAKLFNAGGRGYPDISALAHSYYIKIGGNDGFVDGTSAATPVVGGLIGLINAHRAKSGRPAVGFANPLLYKAFATDPTAFNDVTEGSNRCTESGCTCKEGFGAATGWDAATGLGTPNFGRLLAVIDQIDEARERLVAAQTANA